MPSTKRRVVPFEAPTKASGYAELRRKSSGLAVSSPSPWRTWNDRLFWERLQGVQTTVSENHAFFDRKNNAFEGDLGGDFTMSKQWASSANTGEVFIQWPWEDGDPIFGNSDREFRYSYRGPLFPEWNHSWTFPPYASSSDTELGLWGTKAIALCAPTNPVANSAVALLEAFRDGLPHLVGHTLWRDRTFSAKNAGDEYLNFQFGWLPLVSDIKDFIHGIHHFNKLYEQFVRDGGKGVRRKMSFSPEASYDETVVSTVAHAAAPGYVALQFMWNNGQIVPGHYGQIVRSRETTKQRWFSGMFTYHPPASLPGWRYGDVLNKSRQVLGLDLTPDVVWSIAPWSWAVDWFTSAGDIVHNLTAYQKYGLVLKYGYIMEHSVVRDTYTHVGDLGLRAGTKFSGQPSPIVLTSERKLRRRATPFGFGIDLSSLDNTQKAIIAALGLSRLR